MTLAVNRKRSEIVEALLDAGIDLRAVDSEGEMTLLERATKMATLTFVLFIAVRKESLAIVELLLQAKARLNDGYLHAPGSIIGAAIELGNEGLIQTLVNAGATVIGAKLERIGNIQTALLIQQMGILPFMLHYSGHRILAAAISDRERDLAEFLLQKGAGFVRGGTQGESDENDMTPLAAAIRTHNSSFIRALLNSGARVTDSALESAIRLIFNRHADIELLRQLLARFHGDAPNSVATAVATSNLESLELLREAILTQPWRTRGTKTDGVQKSLSYPLRSQFLKSPWFLQKMKC